MAASPPAVSKRARKEKNDCLPACPAKLICGQGRMMAIQRLCTAIPGERGKWNSSRIILISMFYPPASRFSPRPAKGNSLQ